MTASPLRIAAVGLGWVSQNRHIPAIQRNPAFSLVGVVDRHQGRAEEVALKWGLSRHAQTDSLTNVSWLDEIDAVAIAAPPTDHALLIEEALDRGKHVLTEKPFAMTLEEGERLLEKAEKTQRTLAIVHNFQFSRAAQKLETDLKQGNLGPLKRISAVQLGNPRRRLPSWYETLPLGLFYDESPHFFYLLRKIAGPSLRLEKAHGVAGEGGANTPRLIHLLYRNAEKLPVTVDCAFDSSLSEWHVMVTGEKAIAILDIFRDIYLRLPNDGAHGALSILRTSLAAMGQHMLQYIPNGLSLLRGRLDYGNDEVFSRFAKAIRHQTPPNGIGSIDALAVLRLQHEACAAVKESLLS